MSNDEIKRLINITSSNAARGSDEAQVSDGIGGSSPDEVSQSYRNNNYGKRSDGQNYIQETKDETKKDTQNATGGPVSNVESQIRFTSTEELHERFPIYSANLLNIWRSNNKLTWSQPSCSQKFNSTNSTDVDKVPENVTGAVSNSNVDLVKRVDFNEHSSAAVKENIESILHRRASSDYFNSKLLDNNLKLLKSKFEESELNRAFDCSNRLLEIRKLYDESSNQNDGTDSNISSSCSYDIRKAPSISFRETFTNLIQGCNYFEHKRLIPSAFRKTDLKGSGNHRGASIDDFEIDTSVNTSCAGDENVKTSVESVNNVNNSCKYSGATNQKNFVNRHVDELKISINEQGEQNIRNESNKKDQNDEPNKRELGSKQILDTYDNTKSNNSITTENSNEIENFNATMKNQIIDADDDASKKSDKQFTTLLEKATTEGDNVGIRPLEVSETLNANDETPNRIFNLTAEGNDTFNINVSGLHTQDVRDSNLSKLEEATSVANKSYISSPILSQTLDASRVNPVSLFHSTADESLLNVVREEFSRTSDAPRVDPVGLFHSKADESLLNVVRAELSRTSVSPRVDPVGLFHSTADESLLNVVRAELSPNTSDANSGFYTTANEGDFDGSSAAEISPTELLERLQLSQSSEELHESVGDRSECLFHVTNDGSRGCDNIRLRLMLPALNKVLCSNRVSQMTRTYHDIEAVTRLLEEKEKDLELTARIGKELLITNQKLESTVAALDNELRIANENITQLTHELVQKNELLTILTNDAQDSEDDSEAGNTSGGGGGSMQYEVLQRKIGFLERENRSLRDETDSLCAATDEVEAAEQRLVQDLAAQLSYAQSEVGMIETDLTRTRAELSTLKAENAALVEKLSNAEDRVTSASQQNTELSLIVQLARETQCELAQELAEMKEKYSEVLSILAETQEILKRSKKRSVAGTSIGYGSGLGQGGSSLHLGHTNPDSLAAELECSIFSEFSLDSGIGGSIPRYKRVFDTVRCSSLHSGMATPHTSPSLYYESLGSSITTPSQSAQPLSYPGECPKGIPGIPGSADLEAALRRLTPGAVLARRTALSTGLTDYSIAECPRTPDSALSVDSYSGSSLRHSSVLGQWRIPEKLQIVKPIEGSVTLQHWSALAKPSLSNILEAGDSGVKVRGAPYAAPPRQYTLDDPEEDDDVTHPGKQFQTALHTYTLTNSVVRRPDNYTSVTPSMQSSRMCTAVNSRNSSRAPSRRNSFCLPPSLSPAPPPPPFSLSLSLAKVLSEKGIQAATPSNLVTPNYTPTATPYNSPNRSRDSSPTREGDKTDSSPSSMYSPFGLPGYLVASGAELLRRALVGPMMKEEGRRGRLQAPPPAASTGTGRALVGSNKALTNMSIVEQLEKIGLDNLVGCSSSGAAELPPARARGSSDASRPRVRADLGTVPFKGPSLGSLGAMRKGGLL